MYWKKSLSKLCWSHLTAGKLFHCCSDCMVVSQILFSLIIIAFHKCRSFPNQQVLLIDQSVHCFLYRYKLPSRKHFSTKVIPRMFEETRDVVRAELRAAEYFAATTDMWSSRTTEPYMAFTIHYIDDNFQLHARCLQVSISITISLL